MNSLFSCCMIVGVLVLGLACAQNQESLLGFSFDAARINTDEIKPGGPPKDGIPALTDPNFVSADKADFLKPKDLVIGLTFGEEARAYPIRILDWHEIVNDTIGEQAVLVSYCPLCRSALVFDRKVDGTVREFGVSGLLYRSNVLMYDRQKDPKQESLWSQGMMQAVTGPGAKAKLELKLLPNQVLSWVEWKKAHPKTKVLSNETGHRRPYGRTAYESYFEHDRLMFEVPIKGEKAYPNKTWMLLVEAGEHRVAVSVDEVVKAKKLTIPVGPHKIEVSGVEGPAAVITKQPPDVKVTSANLFYFTLRSMLPDVPVHTP